jgi:hypothetical protein
LSPFDNATAPVAVPVERPKTRRLEESMDDVSTGWSKVIEMAVPGEANVCRTGLVATTLGCAEIAVSGANAVSVVTRSVIQAAARSSTTARRHEDSRIRPRVALSRPPG